MQELFLNYFSPLKRRCFFGFAAMPRRAVGGCFCRKSKAKSKLLSCHSTVERRLGGAARESIYPRRERQCEKAALACFGPRNLPATGAIEAGSIAAGNAKDGTMKVMNKQSPVSYRLPGE